jgi:hypothetical protein
LVSTIQAIFEWHTTGTNEYISLWLSQTLDIQFA